MSPTRPETPTDPAIDPVCRMRIDPAMAPDCRRYDGRTWYFCSRDCGEWFDADPDRYVGYVDGRLTRDAFTRHHGGQ